MKHVKNKIKGETKFVRVNSKTMIEVELSIPDDLAREAYLQKIEKTKPKKRKALEDTYIVKK